MRGMNEEEICDFVAFTEHKVSNCVLEFHVPEELQSICMI